MAKIINAHSIKTCHADRVRRGQARKTLRERGLDFADAGEVFAGASLDLADHREDYGEPRVITMGMLRERVVVIVWTPRGAVRRIIST